MGGVRGVRGVRGHVGVRGGDAQDGKVSHSPRLLAAVGVGSSPSKS